MGSHVGLNFVGGRRGTDSDMHCPYPFPVLGGQGSSDAVISNVGLDNVGGRRRRHALLLTDQ